MVRKRESARREGAIVGEMKEAEIDGSSRRLGGAGWWQGESEEAKRASTVMFFPKDYQVEGGCVTVLDAEAATVQFYSWAK